MYFLIRRSLPARPEPDNTFWIDSTVTRLSRRFSVRYVGCPQVISCTDARVVAPLLATDHGVLAVLA